MDLNNEQQHFDKVIDHLVEELKSLRTNRATPSLVENIKINVYGAAMPLIQVASITSPESRQLLIEPWDKNVLKDIEKAIQTASLGLSIANEGNHLRIMMPAMTEETRKEIIKLLGAKLEKGRTALRSVRDEIKEKIITEEKNKEITEDEKYSLIDELDKMTRNYTDKIAEIGNKKEEEITL